ncbi:MAG: fused MFS/spermidine synthase [Verrucomicrobiae bacterium]|nr:fused MFS/spermidine synthase [Verrucomicrobiae bacterium]
MTPPTPRAISLMAGMMVLTNAFLLFFVQPLAGKLLLPLYGGTASVWSACLLFFQGVLLAGYGITARLLSPTTSSSLRWCFPLLGLAGLLTTFRHPMPSFAPPGTEGWESLQIIAALALNLGIPAIFLSMTSPLLQGWLAGGVRRDSYGWYSLSNMGSCLGLISYPLLIEPSLSLSVQWEVWKSLLLLSVLLSAFLAWKSKSPRPSPASETLSIPHKLGGYWLICSSAGSLLLCSLSAHITTDLASVPLLWMLPLTTYLATYILAFARPLPPGVLCAVFLSSTLLFGLLTFWAATPAWIKILSALLLLSSGCLVCHSELYRTRPIPAGLGSFYLRIAAGGLGAGVFVNFLGPLIFNSFMEIPIGLGLTMACGMVSLRARNLRGPPQIPSANFLALYLLVCLFFLTLTVLRLHDFGARVSDRNFYGTLRIREQGGFRHLIHGTTLHGSQPLNGSPPDPAAYFGPESGMARAFAWYRSEHPGPLRVAVIGLGIGTAITYARIGDEFDFYELDPDVVRLALTQFDYLHTAPVTPRILIGDGRRQMGGAGPAAYDLIFLDAFNSDSIPIHLLTREAFSLYRSKLKPGGILVANITNRHVDLEPVLSRHSQELSWKARIVSHPAIPAQGITHARFALLGPHLPSVGDPLRTDSALSPWTDDYASLIPLMIWNPTKNVRR